MKQSIINNVHSSEYTREEEIEIVVQEAYTWSVTSNLLGQRRYTPSLYKTPLRYHGHQVVVPQKGYSADVLNSIDPRIVEVLDILYTLACNPDALPQVTQNMRNAHLVRFSGGASLINGNDLRDTVKLWRGELFELSTMTFKHRGKPCLTPNIAMMAYSIVPEDKGAKDGELIFSYFGADIEFTKTLIPFVRNCALRSLAFNKVMMDRHYPEWRKIVNLATALGVVSPGELAKRIFQESPYQAPPSAFQQSGVDSVTFE